jgi:hypothetical protein
MHWQPQGLCGGGGEQRTRSGKVFTDPVQANADGLHVSADLVSRPCAA